MKRRTEMEQKNKISVQWIMAVTSLVVCALAGLLMWKIGFNTANLVSTEVVLVPLLLLLMGMTVGSERVTTLIRTATSVILIVLVIASILLWVFKAGPMACIIINGAIFILMVIVTYNLTRLNQ